MTERKTRDLDSLYAAVKKAMPGWAVVSVGSGANAKESVDTVPPAADSVMPSMQVLKKKYLGSPSHRRVLRDGAAGAAIDANVKTVIVESEGMKKTVGVSEEGKVLWRQG